MTMKISDLPELRDERAVAVENASYRWSCAIYSVGLLCDICYRAWFTKDHACWDLFMILIVAGNIPTIVQLREQVMVRKVFKVLILTAAIAAVVGGAIAALMAQIARYGWH
jgi:hypothetical protein